MNKYKPLAPQILINILIIMLTFSLEVKHTIADNIGDICGNSTKFTFIKQQKGEYVYVCSSNPISPTRKEILDELEKEFNGTACDDCLNKKKCEGHCMCEIDNNTKKFDFKNTKTNGCTLVGSGSLPGEDGIPLPPSIPPCPGKQLLYICLYGKGGNDWWELSCNCTCQTLNGKRGNRTKICTTCQCDENLVKLSDFTAKPTNKGISLNWNTEAESDSQGFRMWRAIPNLDHYCGCSGNIDDYTQIQVLDKEGKPVLIPAKGTETSGYDYSYLDKDAKPGIAYCYALEDVDSKGESKFYFEYVAFTQDNLEESE